MKDTLRDLIKHTHSLGVIDLIKVSGTDKETKISALADNHTVVVEGTMKTPVAELIGVFGMPNLDVLNNYLNLSAYAEDPVITVTRNTKDSESVPTNINFSTKSKRSNHSYRLMSKVIIEEKVPPVKFKGVSKWDIEFEPTVTSIQELKENSSANPHEETITFKSDKSNLWVYVGDPSTHSGEFVLHDSISGSLSRAWKWPVKIFLSILSLPGDKTVKISDQGAAEITVDSGIAVYRYILPGLSK